VIELISQAAIVLICVTVLAMLLRKGSVHSNAAEIERWFDAMDVVVNGQRYRGSRSSIVEVTDERRLGAFGYQVYAVCETRSGRVFEVYIASSLSKIIDWKLTPISLDQRETTGTQIPSETDTGEMSS
jgi:hypothetical protein